ncbi:MAG: VanW family protein [Chloroflexota bacterium]
MDRYGQIPYTNRLITQLAPFVVALIEGIVCALLLCGLFVLGFQVRYAGRIYPGVSVYGVDLSALRPEEAVGVVNQRLDFPVNGKILFQDGAQVWVAEPAQLGLFLDPETSVLAAFEHGRSGGLILRLRDLWHAFLRYRVNIPLHFVYDERMAYNYLQGIASQVDRLSVEATLHVSGTEVVVQPGQVGRTVDIAATLAGLNVILQRLEDEIVPLIVTESPPVILDVEEQAEQARQILSAPLTLKLPHPETGDPGPWTFDLSTLTEMLVIEVVNQPEGGAHYQVGLKTGMLRAFLQERVSEIDRLPQYPRFIFNDDSRQLELIRSTVVGRKLDIEASIWEINQRLLNGEHEIELVIEYAYPPVTDEATAEQLGIKEAVSVQSSYFYGSSTGRIQNIQIASSQFHGLLVAPGETFSMGEALGDVSLDTGYAEALIIYGDRTIKGVGGGVCQVSTTLFRTAFFGGYQIDERHPHAYRVYYYELTASGSANSSLAGLDATVFLPLVDLKFTNDSPYWILMETYVDVSARRLTWKFYSTSDGRVVEWETTGLTNKVDSPDPAYHENPELDKGEIRQADWAVEGADVTVTRIVTRGGEVLHRDVFKTHYLPWQAVCEYGPGTKGMPPKKPDPDDPCKPDAKKEG